MYRSFYQLTHKPFQISTDPGFLWLGENHKEALANLTYGLREGNGFVVLTGDVGTGKTTLVNALLASLDSDVLVANITHPKLDATEFLRKVVRTFDPSASFNGKADMLLFLEDFLRSRYAEGRRVLLVIDEAHRLSVDLLEEVRLWSNMEHLGQRLINIFFVGQSELKELLASSACLALRQRIVLFHHLQSLSESEVRQYVAHRLGVAGTQRRLFSQAALRQIWKLSGGYPRRVNIICDRALLTGYVKAISVIDAETVLECAREIGVLDPKAPPLERIRGVGDTLRRRFKQAAVVHGLKGRLAEMGRRLRTSGVRIVEGVRSQTEQTGHALAEQYHRVRPAWKGLVLMTGLVAGGLALLVFWLTGMERSAPTFPSHPTAADEIDEAKPYLLSQVERLKPFVEFKNGSPIALVVPDTPMALSAHDQKEKFTDDTASVQVDGPSTLELASAALGQSDYQTAIELIEADPDRAADLDIRTRSLYAQALLGRAEQIMTQSPQAAQQLVSTAIEADPGRADAYAILGKLHTLSKAYALAIEAYRQAVAIDSEQSDALFNLGYIYASTGMLADAETALRRVVVLKPAYLDKALFNLAVVHHKQGKTGESIEALERALAIDPENEKARIYLRQLKEAPP